MRILTVLLTSLLLCGSLLCCSQLAFCQPVPTAIEDQAQIGLEWDDNTETDLEGYNVHVGLAPGEYETVYMVTESDYVITGLTEGVTYYMAVTAFDTAKNESDYSVEVSHTPVIVDRDAPGKPQNLKKYKVDVVIIEAETVIINSEPPTN
jgi:hypothetical protein